MKSEHFQELKKRIESELKITPENVEEKSLQLSNFHTQCLQIFIKELGILKNKLIEKDKIYGQLYHKYKYNYQYTLETKNEVDAYIKADDLYYNIALECANIEVQVKYLEDVCMQINNLGFRIKNFIDLRKIDKGLM